MSRSRGSPGTLADRLRLARNLAGYSRPRLAREVGVTASAAVQWEQPDGTLPNVENLARIANLLEVQFEWLATGRGESSLTSGAPAVALGDFAHDQVETRLLQMFRKLSLRQRERLLAFLESIPAR